MSQLISSARRKSSLMNDPQEAERALFGAILEYGNQCISQASLKTGIGVEALTRAKEQLLERHLIRPVLGQATRDELHLSYEANI